MNFVFQMNIGCMTGFVNEIRTLCARTHWFARIYVLSQEHQMQPIDHAASAAYG
jgi:hypothetical protein